MRIVALQPSVSIILDRLGCLDSIAACTKYCLDAVPALRECNLPIVHDSWSIPSDELSPIAAENDPGPNGRGIANPSPGRPVLVIASVPYRQESLAAILKAGRPVLALAPHTLSDVYSDISHIAHILNVPGRGEAGAGDLKVMARGVLFFLPHLT